jgi:hypothetical protein
MTSRDKYHGNRNRHRLVLGSGQAMVLLVEKLITVKSASRMLLVPLTMSPTHPFAVGSSVYSKATIFAKADYLNPVRLRRKMKEKEKKEKIPRRQSWETKGRTLGPCLDAIGYYAKWLLREQSG